MNLNKKTRIAIISHFSFKDQGKGAVFPQNIRSFLLKKIGKLTYIDHPFPQSNFPASQMTIYESGAKTYQLTTPKFELPTLILFIYQLFLTIFFLIRKPIKYDLCIACDNLSSISVLLLRGIGLIKKIVYYGVDYTPKRYSNPLLNNLYQYMDKLACRISDRNWIAVENIIIAKVKNGLDLKRCAPFQIVPIGFGKEGIFIRPIKKVNRFNLVFVGVLYEKQGLQLVIKVLPKLIKKFPKVHLTIVGSGPFETQIKKLVEQQVVSSYVTFTGYISNHQEIVKLLSDSGIGLAAYNPSLGDFTYYADPSKIKLYLLCGIPVITTKVPPIAKEIIKRKAGFVIDYSEDDLIKALENLLKDNKTYSKFRENALKMAKSYDNNLILDKAFKELP